MKKPALQAAFRVVLPYVVIAGLWILMSDQLLGNLLSARAARGQWSMYKGWAFVLVTALLLSVLLRLELRARERSEEELRRSEADLAEAQRLAKVGSWRFDIARNAVRWSRELYRMFDVEEKGFGSTYESFLNCIHPEDLSRVRQVNAEARSGGKPFELEYRILTRLGQVKIIREIGYAKTNEEGKVVGLFGTAQDITEHKRVAEALRESEERFSSAFKSAAIGMGLVGLDGRWLQVNRSLCKQLGYTETELLAGTFQDITHPDDLETDLAHVRQILCGEIETYQMEKRYYHKTGEIVWGLLSVSLVRNSQGRPAYFISQVQDITERKQAELGARRSRSQLRALLARLQQLREEERTRIAREVHDVLGQMLTGLKMDMSWWERRFAKISDEPLRHALEAKVETTSCLTDMMIETVQKISRELRPSVLDNIGLGAALQFEARQFQERTGIICEVSVPAETSPIDPALATGIFRVFQELLTNVARHAEANRVVVTLGQTEEKVWLKVRDNGRGIREEELRDPKSLGLLGMSERASLMGGGIEITGTAGDGTTAVLTIPVKSG